jgi:hypothetical protein
MSKKQSSKQGISFGTALTLIFVVLKLCNLIEWSWFWVLSPLWIGGAIIVSVFIIGLLIMIMKK